MATYRQLILQEIAPQQQPSSAPVDCLDNAQSVGAILPQFWHVLCSKTVVTFLRGLIALARTIALVTFLFLVKQRIEVFPDLLAEYSFDAILPAIAVIVYIPCSLNDAVRLDYHPSKSF